MRGAARRLLQVAVLLAIAGRPGLTIAQPTPVAGASAAALHLPHSAAEVHVDGVLDDPVWKDAVVIDLTTETGPGENVPAPVETHAYLVEDGTRLLVAFDARDPHPETIRAYLRDRDRAYNDDFVGIVIDSFNDRRYAFEFFANALGVQMDLTNDDVSQRESDSWDAIWDSAGKIDGRGFVVEMAIPLSQLRFRNTDGERVWGIDVLRFRPRSDRTRISNNALERGRNCYLCQLGRLQGLEGVEAGKNLQIVPSLTASRGESRADPLVDPWQRDGKTDVGLNVRWGVTEALTANLALNPDFSQVEADVAQLDINQPFALFYPETRPLFLEGADYFSTPIQAVFTRTVADPRIGAKLTGQPGDSTLGAFAAEDEVTNLLIPGPQDSSTTSLDQSNTAFVGRYSHNTSGGAQLGALFTSRSGAGYHNQVGGLDGLIRIGGRHTLRAQFLLSDTAYPTATATTFAQPQGAFDGAARLLRYSFNHRDWYADVEYHNYDAGFRADSGFLPRVGIEQTDYQGARVWQRSTGDRAWKQIQLGTQGVTTYSVDGSMLDRNTNAFMSFNGPMQSYTRIDVGPASRVWNGQRFDGNGKTVFSQLRPRGGLNVQMFVRYGDEIDFENTRLALERRYRPNVEWNVNQHLLLRLQHTKATLTAKTGPRIFEANLTDLRVTWQFNVRSFIRFTTQRQDVERNLAMYTDPTTQAHSLTVGTQLLYAYKLNPQTVLYVGYADAGLEDDRMVDVLHTNRTAFAKLSYAWLR
ncbi:MAG TPA: DUF5916 domain-containing protein [Gammaproteobacteria bacterium]|nr:DUF5916 domain-containing protein [Gammaproteobacteria bacterium]